MMALYNREGPCLALILASAIPNFSSYRRIIWPGRVDPHKRNDIQQQCQSSVTRKGDRRGCPSRKQIKYSPNALMWMWHVPYLASPGDRVKWAIQEWIGSLGARERRSYNELSILGCWFCPGFRDRRSQISQHTFKNRLTALTTNAVVLYMQWFWKCGAKYGLYYKCNIKTWVYISLTHKTAMHGKKRNSACRTS